MERTISVLGCGWLGFPLAKTLIGEGFIVKGSTTRNEKIAELQSAGIEAFQLNFLPEVNGTRINEFFESEILILNIPPSRRPDVIDWYTGQIKAIISLLRQSTIKHLLFTSSTSVYPSTNGVVKEDDLLVPDKESGVALLKVEEMLRQEKQFSTTVLRLAGLFGPDRHPGRFLAGKKDVANPDAPVNLIHLEDCIGMILEVIRQQTWGEVYNACTDEHPTRREFYTLAAENLGLEPPEFNDLSGGDYKIVDNTKIKHRLNYTFKFPDPGSVFS